MDYKIDGNQYLLRVDKGEGIAASIRADRVELGLFRTDIKQFVGHTYEGMYEIASLNGNISQMEGKVYLHLHAVIGDEENETRGGHLVEARVSATAEIVITAFEGGADRRFSEEIGLNLFAF